MKQFAKRLLFITFSFLLASLAIFPSLSMATGSGQNGKINAYLNADTTQFAGCPTNSSQLGQTTFDSNFSNPSRLSFPADSNGFTTDINKIAWSPDGKYYAFLTSRSDEIGIASSDGGSVNGQPLYNVIHIYRPNYSEVSSTSIAWSSDGSTLAFSNSSGIYTISDIGTNLTRVVEGDFSDLSWSPDGNRLAFTQPNSVAFATYEQGVDSRDSIGVINRDGTGLRLFTKSAASSFDRTPDWSPDGNKIVFSSDRSLEGTSQWNEAPQLFTMNVDGSNVQQITNNYAIRYEFPVWSPDGSKIVTSKDHFDAPTTTNLAILNSQNGAEESTYATGCNTAVSSIGWQPITGSNSTVFPATPPVTAPAPAVTLSNIYRFYSPLLMHHLFTADPNESNSIRAHFPSSVWSYEGVAFKVNGTANCSNGRSVYRFYSELLKTHLYTMDENEKSTILRNYPPSVWHYEGVAYCADDQQVPGTKPVYRFYSERFKTHLYTMDENEKNSIMSRYRSDVYRYEGVAYYAYPS